MEPIADTFDAAFSKTVDLANKMADKDKDADLWDIADGMLAGAIQYWLYSRQPCGDTRCQDCMPISTAEGRMSELKRLIEQLARFGMPQLAHGRGPCFGKQAGDAPSRLVGTRPADANDGARRGRAAARARNAASGAGCRRR